MCGKVLYLQVKGNRKAGIKTARQMKGWGAVEEQVILQGSHIFVYK